MVGIRPEMAIAVLIVHGVYQNNGHDVVITSAVDGRHSRNSLHYTGAAVDIRIREISVSIVGKIVQELKEALGHQFDVVLEEDHIHIEFQPKR